MRHLREQNYRVIALRDVEQYLTPADPPDPLLTVRSPKREKLTLPVEMEATRADLPYWLGNMRLHRYSTAEMAAVCGTPESEIAQQPVHAASHETPRLLPYPGGRHVRIGFLEGAINPLRGTKAAAFLPWDPASYAVVDLPEAIFTSDGLLFLAHTHVPTIWNEKNVIIENTDWIREANTLRSEWKLPNAVGFGATLKPAADGLEMELWLRNGTPDPLQKLRTQICVLLKQATGFNQQTIANKTFGKTEAVVKSADGKYSIATEWERCGRTWGNAQCPCMHSDPVLPDCAAGETVRVRGRLRFVQS
jgi:hypothetical protein